MDGGSGADLKFDTAWVQERDNHLALLDTFFGALRPEESLCFFYASSGPRDSPARTKPINPLIEKLLN